MEKLTNFFLTLQNRIPLCVSNKNQIINLKYFFIWLYILVQILSCTPEKKYITVFDNEHDLTKEQISKLDSLYKSHERKTTNEIVLVTTNSFSPDTSILFFSVDFLRKHGIGKKDKNNGVVIVLNNTKHQLRIGIGYGTEKVLKDEIAKKIIDSLMIPQFKKGEIFGGLWQGSLAIVNFLETPGNKIK